MSARSLSFDEETARAKHSAERARLARAWNAEAKKAHRAEVRRLRAAAKGSPGRGGDE